jgi:hypothetical protein
MRGIGGGRTTSIRGAERKEEASAGLPQIVLVDLGLP